MKTCRFILISIVLLLCLPAARAAVEGTWFCEYYGMTTALYLDTDGSYLWTVMEDGESGDAETDRDLLLSRGSWRLKDNILTLTDAEGQNIPLIAEDEGLVYREEGIEYYAFTREQTDREDAVIEAASLWDFEGVWRCAAVERDGEGLSADDAALSFSVTISGCTASACYFQVDEEAFEGPVAFFGGKLKMTQPAVYPGGSDTVWTMELTRRGRLRVSAEKYGHELVFTLDRE